MYSPLISVIVPIYKVEQYLRRCLDSIVNQTYTNLEIILVDDGSPDKSPQICDEYASKDCRIIVIHKKNGGLSDARNAGLDVCKGEYISFVDSDDWVSLEYINELYSSIKESFADIAIVNHKHTISFPAKEFRGWRHVKLFSKQQALFELIAKQSQPFVVSWGKLYRKDLFNNIRFPVGKYHEDEYIAHLLINVAANVVYSNRIMYFYFQRPNSITATSHTYDLIEAFENRMCFVIENSFKNLTSFAASNLCWKYIKLCYEKKQHNEDFKLFINKAREKQALTTVRKLSDVFLFIFLRHPNLYFFYKKLF